MSIPEPEPLARGRFSVYETPQGGLHLAYRVDGEAEDRHAEIPSAVIKMAKAASNGNAGNPLAMLKGLARG